MGKDAADADLISECLDSPDIRKITPSQSALVQVIQMAPNNKLYWSEDLRPICISVLSKFPWISAANISGMEKALRCFNTKVTVIPPLSFDFVSGINADDTTPTDNNTNEGDTPKGKQLIKPQPVRKVAAKGKESLVEGGASSKGDTGLLYDAGKHTMNSPKVHPNIYDLNVVKLNILIVQLVCWGH